MLYCQNFHNTYLTLIISDSYCLCKFGPLCQFICESMFLFLFSFIFIVSLCGLFVLIPSRALVSILEEKICNVFKSHILLVQVITRINYGQSISISGLAGAVSLAGSGGGLWSIRGGNWQMAAGLINHSNVLLHLNEEIKSVSYFDGFYELNSSKGESYTCDITVIATPLDELNIHFKPEISIPKRTLQHTYTTFIRGLVNPVSVITLIHVIRLIAFTLVPFLCFKLNHCVFCCKKYFGLNRVSDIPELVGTIETSDVPFSSISVIKRHDKEDMTYKILSREPMQEALLDDIFRYAA